MSIPRDETNLFDSELNESAVPLEDNLRDDQQSPERALESMRPRFRTGAASASSAFGSDMLPYTSSGPSTAGLRGSYERDRLLARAQRGTPFQDYNVKLGPLPLKFGAGLGIDITDNVDGSTTARQADLTLRPLLDVSGSIRLTRYNSFTIQVGIGYLKYLKRSERDTILTTASVGIDTGSEISFDVKIGNFLLNFHDLPEIPRAQADLITQRSPLDYSRFTNVAGVTALWNVNSKVAVSLRYDHINAIGLTDSRENPDSASDRVSGLIQYDVNDRLRVGLNGTLTSVTYEEAYSNNADTSEVGVFGNWSITDNLGLEAAFGFQHGTFDSAGITQDRSRLSGYFANLTISNRLNSYLRHELSVGHESQIGTSSNFVETNYLRYQAQWEVIAGVNVASVAFVEDADESGGIFAQNILRYGLGGSFGLDLTKDLDVRVQYGFTRRTGDGASELGPREGVQNNSLDYYENRLTLEFRYAL